MPYSQRSNQSKSLGRGAESTSPLVKKMNATARSSMALTSGVEVSVPIRLKEIRRVLKMGAAVLPVVAGGKAPAIAGGHKAASKDRAQVEAHFRANPRLNYGIATGDPSGFVALDIDGPEGRATLAALVAKQGPLPKTVKVMTPHGVHYYFKAPSHRIPNSVSRVGDGIDVRADGGYVVGPGSQTPNGVYKFALGQGPEEVEIKSLPPWLTEMVGAKRATSEGVSGSPRKLAAAHELRAKACADAVYKSECDRLRKAPLHQRNNTLNTCAFKLGRFAARQLIDPVRATAELTQIAKAIGLEEREIAATIASGLKAGVKNPARLPFEKGDSPKGADRPPNVSDDELTKELAALGENDIANAERFVRRCGHMVVVSPSRGFMVFDGKRYRNDDRYLCVELAKEVIKKIADEPPYMPTEEARTRRAKFAQESRSKAAIDRMLELAKGLLFVEDKALDADPWLLNTETCTIDVRAGRYQPHDSRDLLTKLAPVPAKPNSVCPTFAKFIGRITGGNAELATYIQKAVGYSLTGITSAQVLFFVYGKSGNNGKSTLVNLIREMLGDYAAHTPTETLLTKNYDNAIPADLARLEGKRMVTAIESNVNRQLDEAKIKAMTGGEPITARHLYKNFSEFTPLFKLWFVANDRPHVRATDDAIWRRIRVIPLNVKIPASEVDPDLSSKLRAELPGILSWAIRGALAWQRDGLDEPESVIAASAGWRKSVDHVRRFVTENLIIGCEPSYEVPAGELHSRFKTWCVRQGEAPLSPGKFKARLEEAFDITHARTKVGSVWRGVRLKT